MTSSEKTLVCGRCEIVPKASLVDGQPDRIICPGCGIEADFEEARELAVIHAGKEISRDAIKGLQDSLVRSTCGSKHVEYIPGKIPAPTLPAFVFK